MDELHEWDEWERKSEGVHKQQTLSYLKATGLRLGILANFGTPSVEHVRIAS